MITPPGMNGNGSGLGATPNGWATLIPVIGVSGTIAMYLVWWLTQALGGRLDRMIELLDSIARAVNAHAR